MTKLEEKLIELGYEQLLAYTDFITKKFFQSFIKPYKGITLVLEDGKITHYFPLEGNKELKKDLEELKQCQN